MAQVTPDERRRVAQSLRKLQHPEELPILELISKSDEEHLCDAIGEPVGHALRYKAERLADLIDPTCEMVRFESDSDFTDEPHYKCSRCGCDLIIDEWDAADDYRVIRHAPYCPRCGARIVKEDA